MRPRLPARPILLVLLVAVSVVSTALSAPGVAGAQTDPAPSTAPLPDQGEQAAPPAPSGPTPEELWAWFSALPPIPAGSGEGRRIVYSIGQQRVWLVEGGEWLHKTYLVSGRRGLPGLGTYRIYSTSRYARSGSVSMEYMMRFARGRSKAIGFHSIPVDRRGRPLQRLEDLGSPRSHGCVRQWIGDAAYLWEWAPVGTTVVVVA